MAYDGLSDSNLAKMSIALRTPDYGDLLPQMRERRRLDDVDFKFFLALFLVGYFKKAVVSDGIAPSVSACCC